jgi:hypothetical protein
MSWGSKGDSFKTILKIVIGTIFTVVALAVLFKAATTSSEKRSKAAEAQRVYMAWEFSANTTEGWLGNNITGLSVKDGLLTGTIGADGAYIINKKGPFSLSAGTKKLTIRMSLVSPQTSRTVPKGFPTNRPMPVTTFPFALNVSYFSNGVQRNLPLVKGAANGVLTDYTLTFLDIAPLTIDSLQITVNSVRPGTILRVDSVRLLGTVTTLTTTPKPPPPTTSTPKPTPCPTVCDKFGKCISACPTTPRPSSMTTPRPATPSPTPVCATACDKYGNCTSTCQTSPRPTSIQYITPSSTPLQPVTTSYTPTPTP